MKKRVNNETQAELFEETASKKRFNGFKLKHGSYSVAVTAAFLVIVIAFNWLFMTLSKKYHFEIDMTPEKIHSMDKANVEYLKGLKEEVEITVVAKDANEYAMMMASFVPEHYGVYYGENYFSQTATIAEKYGTYNKNIKVRFLDAQSTEFTTINQKYTDLDISYGDILVTHKISDSEERIRKLSFEDVYNYDTDTYTGATIVTSNNIENALTNAIIYVISGEEKKAVLLTGHSQNDNTSNYISLLKLNGYTVEINSKQLVTEIPKDANLVAVLSASTDFYGSELQVISEFLENDGKLGKGFVYFADASAPNLPNLNAFLEEWGISFKEGILFENDDPNPNDASILTMELGNTIDTTGMKNGSFVAAYNVPMVTNDPDGPDGTQYETKNVVVTSDTTVIAPVGAPNGWKPENNDDVGQYVTAATTQKLSYDIDNNRLTSFVVAFSSVQFIQSELAEYETSDNKDIVLYCTDLAANITESDVKFLPKTITTESYTDVTLKGVKLMQGIFVIGIPLAVLVICIYVTIRRRRT